jgi:hypothetical protein
MRQSADDHWKDRTGLKIFGEAEPADYVYHIPEGAVRRHTSGSWVGAELEEAQRTPDTHKIEILSRPLPTRLPRTEASPLDTT